MPKVKFDSNKGLIQEAGDTFDMNGEFFTNMITRTVVLSGASASKDLLQSELPCVVVLSGSNASTVSLPSSPPAGSVVSVIAATAQAHVVDGGNTQMLGATWDNSNGTTLARNAVTAKSSITLANPAIGDHLQFRYSGDNWVVWGWTNDTPTLG